MFSFAAASAAVSHDIKLVQHKKSRCTVKYSGLEFDIFLYLVLAGR